MKSVMVTDLRPVVSNNLARLRKKKGLTQGELAERFSYSDKTVSKWEKGDVLPDLDTLKELADFYGVTLDYFTLPHDDENDKNPINSSPKWVLRNAIIATFLALFAIVSVFAALDCIFRINPIPGWESYHFYFWMMPALALVALFSGQRNKWPTFCLISLLSFVWLGALATYLELGYDLGADGWACWFVMLVPIPVSTLFLFAHFSRLSKRSVSLTNDDENNVE